MVNPVLVALDLPDGGRAVSLARSLKSYVGGFKVGLELLMSAGPGVVSEVAGLGLPVFVDAKLADIPNTVAGAVRALGRHGARWVSVHGGGGPAMVAAAVDALAQERGEGAGVLVVTVLTSLDDADLAAVGVERTVGTQVEAMAVLAVEAGAKGVVCSPREIPRVVGRGLLVVTPGIRLESDDSHDQKRVSTPGEALAAGADYLVVGRSITAAQDPIAAAAILAASLTG